MLAKTNKGLNESITSLQATAGRSGATIFIMKVSPFQAMPALASGA
jgi:hypothetical protein